MSNNTNDYKLISNSGSNENLNKFIVYLLNDFFTALSIDSNQIRVFTLKKINFSHIYKIEFSVSSTTNDILNFLKAINRAHRSIIIHSFKYQLVNNLTKNFQQELIFNLICYISSLDAHKLILEVSRLDKKITKSVLEKMILDNYSLGQFKILGFLSNNNKQSFSLVRLPNKKIYKIILGNYLGIDQGLVIGIYPNKIIIKNNKTNEIISLSNKLRKLVYDKNFS